MRKKLFTFALVSLAIVFVWWWFCLPAKLFTDPTSTVLNDRDGNLLGARIAADGQWRFPESDSVPHRFATCLIEFEDRRFYSHPGFDLRGMARALRQNMREGEVVSGASTLTMQTMRMSRRAESRSIWQKFVEIAWATRAEFRYSKETLLQIYASNAPFGGNVVGLETAAWRYYNRPAHALTWAESATLAVLPNAPGLIFPGRNRDALRTKRNRLLERLRHEGHLDTETYELALLEPIPGAPLRLPGSAPHLLQRAVIEGRDGLLTSSTIDAALQAEISATLERHMDGLRRNYIFNGAVLIADVETGAVRCYVGNAEATRSETGQDNDMIVTPRSSGSILKPFLYGQMVGKSALAPKELVADIPTQYAGFAPKNFDESYAGAVPADEALARSLNIPAVRMLKEYGVPAFHHDLRQMGFTTITQSPSHYGLSLILGGAETTLWDLVGAYRIMAQQLVQHPGSALLEGLSFIQNQAGPQIASWSMEVDAVWAVANAMGMLNRPRGEENWESFSGAQRIAWKTGTSYGFRDAWAVGFNKRFVVGVWIGNANGEGRPGITGLNAAAPVLFDVFNRLPQTPWFDPPAGALSMGKVCVQSGMLASEKCPSVEDAFLPNATLRTTACTYCRYVHLNSESTHQVNSDCYRPSEIQRRKQFVLPPLMEWFYKKHNGSYASLPPWLPACAESDREQPMRMIYPRESSMVFIPRELNGIREKVVLKAAHRDPQNEIHWHLNDTYLGTTRDLHHMEIQAAAGTYGLTLIDANGMRLETVLNISDGER